MLLRDRRLTIALGVSTTFLLLANVMLWRFSDSDSHWSMASVLVPSRKCKYDEVLKDDRELVQLPLLSIEPKTSFRDNLRNDTKYITTWPSNGWTNDVMAYVNLILLGLMTDRVPILPRFHPTHVGEQAGHVLVSTVFDLDRLSKAIKTPILEWTMLKHMQHEPVEPIGCWSTHQTLFNDNNALRTTTEFNMGLDITYTAIPESSRLGHVTDAIKASFAALAGLSYPRTRAAAIASPPRPVAPGQFLDTVLEPDDHVLCFDYTYDLRMHEDWEWDAEWSPAWHSVGKHMHFEPKLVALTETMIKNTFGIRPAEPVPPMITLHARRGDFAQGCAEGASLQECLPSLSAFQRRVAQVREELAKERGVEHVPLVLVSSDEQDPEWWQQVHELGWRAIDHDRERTEELYGKWYPVFIDVVAQSMGVGFVGTERSTLSLLSEKRVVDWNNGIARYVRWGWVGADDYDL